MWKTIRSKLIDEYDENIDEKLEIVSESKNKCNSCIFCIVLFSIFLQLILESVLILFTINILIVIKKLLLDMIISIKRKIFNMCLKDTSCKQRINEGNKTNKYQKLSLLFLQSYNWPQKFWRKVVKNWQKIIQKHWYLQRRGYIEEKEAKKYLFFDCTDENNELLKKYNDIFNEIRDKIKEISSGEYDYEKDCMKIKFNSNNNLSLNKQLKLRLMTITIRSVFEEDGKLYPQVYLHDTLYELNV